MKHFINGIKEHCWHEFCQDWIERRDGKKHDKDCNYGLPLCEYDQHIEFYNRWGSCTIHLRAEEISSGALFEIRLLCADRKGKYPIIALANIDGIELIEEFDCDGLSKDGMMKLHYESIHFDAGDYVVTNRDTIGIFANGWYMFACIEKNGTEHLDLFGCGTYKRLATEDEINLLDEMLWANNKKWNNETKQLEDTKFCI